MRKRKGVMLMYCLSESSSYSQVDQHLSEVNESRFTQFLTTHLYQLKTESDRQDAFPEVEDDKICKYYTYERKTESYEGKEGKEVKYTRPARVDKKDEVSVLVATLIQNSERYLKHRSYADNVNSVLPMKRIGYKGKFVELDFSENLALRPKHEVQSAHFSGRQHSLHCSIVQPGEIKYHYHLSNDTKHDPVFVDEVLRDIIMMYYISNEDIIIQSDNAPTQYKNKFAFGLLQNLSNEFNLRIIRTYGCAGHGKGIIDVMSSFGVKNVLRRDIVTQDVFFDTSEVMVDHLHIKNPQFYYATIEPQLLAQKRHALNETIDPIEIPGCMKKHLMVFTPNTKEVMSKEYFCDCSQCLQLDFDKCLREFNEIEDTIEHQEIDNPVEIEDYEHIFDFVETPSYITLRSGRTLEPLYFVFVGEKGVADKLLIDSYDHTIDVGARYFKGNFLKLTRSKHPNCKQFQVIQQQVIFPPEEIYDTYVDINEQLQININVYNGLVNKAQS